MPLYKADPNDSTKQIPDNPIQGSQYSKATCPTNEIVSKRPTYVNINSEGEYAFLYETTSSFGGNVAGQIANFETGSVIQSANAGGIKLDISPGAWRRIDAADAVGQVTFVYVRVR